MNKRDCFSVAYDIIDCNPELNKYLKHSIFSTYKYNEELDLYLNKCLIQKF